MVAMGRALMMDPSVLLLDEPSAGLSPVFQDEVFVNCRKINAVGVSIVMVEQNARRCLQVCRPGVRARPGHQRLRRAPGAELLNDPKVIELYLGTLAAARRSTERRPDGADRAVSNATRGRTRRARPLVSDSDQCRRMGYLPSSKFSARALPMLPSTP